MISERPLHNTLHECLENQHPVLPTFSIFLISLKLAIYISCRFIYQHLLSSAKMRQILVAFNLLALISFCSAQKDPHWWNGRNTIIHLFEWKWQDIADECERFLQHKGYAGVQVSIKEVSTVRLLHSHLHPTGISSK